MERVLSGSVEETAECRTGRTDWQESVRLLHFGAVDLR